MRKHPRALESRPLRLSPLLAAGVAVVYLALGSAPAVAAETAASLKRDGKWEDLVLLLRARTSPELRIGPGFNREFLELGDALFMSQRREEAIRHMLQAAEAAKPAEWRDTLLRKAGVYGRQFYTNVAFQVFEEGNQAIREGKPGVALERFAQTLATERDQVEALLRQGQLKALAGDHDSAAEMLRHALRLLPPDVSEYADETRLWLAHALYERGERERARELARDIRIFPRKAADYLIAFRLAGDRRDRKLAEQALAAEQRSARGISDLLFVQLGDALLREASVGRSE